MQWQQMFTLLLLLLLLLQHQRQHGGSDTGGVHAAKFAPNHFLGTCLDDKWVAEVESEYDISATHRDAQGRLFHPYLHTALKKPRFTVNDPRTAAPMSSLYQRDCLPPNSIFYGVGATIDANGDVVDPGRANNTLVLELKGWPSIKLTTLVFSIIAQELLGYEVSFFATTNADDLGERLSSTGKGACSPVHANLEVWVDPFLTRKFHYYANEWYDYGSIGYSGRSGLYTTTGFIKDGLDATPQPFSADFWRDYRDNEDLISRLSVAALKSNAAYYPPVESGCADDTFGCRDACSKTDACTTREAQGKQCLVVIMMYAYYDTGYLQAVFANNGIAAYFCFLGYASAESYAIEAAATGKPVAFYHYEPDPLHVQFAGRFERVALPRSTPERSRVATGTFGERGYGEATSNPVAVDFATTWLEKLGASILEEHQPLESLLSRIGLDEYTMNMLLQIYVNITNDATAASSQVDDPAFATACTWLKRNYQTWSLWLGRLPLCSVYSHVTYDIVDCETLPHKAVYKWITPHPDDATRSYTCDGGLTELPAPLVTSRSCDWLEANMLIWIFWTAANKPACDSSFYSYSVSACDRAGSKRQVTYKWLLEDPTDSKLSTECALGDALPAPVLLDCEYVPTGASDFAVVVVLAAIIGALLLLAMVFVYCYRTLPIIKRSQYEFLLVLLAGGVVICVSVCIYAGAPTRTLCTIRPMGIALGFTFIFGSLVVKSLRVYRVFLSGAMKRVVLSTKTMFKILGLFVAIDVVIIGAWNIVDPSKPVFASEATAAVGGDAVDRLRCTSSSFIYTALLIFWKAVLLFAGLYLSFLIRKVSSDFQESIWIFASALVVLFTSVILLPMAYLVELPAITFYMFFSLLLLASTATVMSLMIVPKILRLHAEANDTTTVSGTTSRGTRSSIDSSSSNGERSNGDNKVAPKTKPVKNKRESMASIVPMASGKKKKPQRTQVMPFKSSN